jgi:hypothetical protein
MAARLIPILAVALVSISGCAQMQAQRNANLKAEVTAAANACRAQIPEKIGNYKARAQCIADARERILPPSPGLSFLNAMAVSLAARIDAGQLSTTDFKVQMDALAYQIRLAPTQHSCHQMQSSSQAV